MVEAVNNTNHGWQVIGRAVPTDAFQRIGGLWHEGNGGLAEALALRDASLTEAGGNWYAVAILSTTGLVYRQS